MTNSGGFISESIWRDRDFRALPRGAQATYVQLTSQKELDRSGMLPYQPTKWVKGCDDMSLGDLDTDLKVLAAARFIVVDEDTDEVFVRSYMRNANVITQPNLLKNALKCARMVASDHIRRELANELRRIRKPGCAEVADEIDPGPDYDPEPDAMPNPTETHREPFANPSETLREPLNPSRTPREPRGEGEGEGEKVTVSSYSPRDQSASRARPQTRATLELNPRRPIDPAPDDPRADTPPPDDRASFTADAQRIVRDTLGAHWRTTPAAVRTALAFKTSALLGDGIPTTDVIGGIEVWLGKPHLGPQLLDQLVSEYQRSHHAPPAATRNSTTDRKMHATQSLKRPEWDEPTTPALDPPRRHLA